jgi:hypothetical protein
LIRFVAVVVLVAGAVVAVGLGTDLGSPAARPDGVSADASAELSAEPAFAEAHSSTARPAPHDAAPKTGGEIIPWLNPLPPLLSLILSAESQEVRAHAQKLNLWLKVTVEVGVQKCWKRRPPELVWAEFSAEIDRGVQPNSLAFRELRLTKIHGDYVLDPEETRCFSETLAAITGRIGNEGEVEALAPYFPMFHRFAFEWPCGSCVDPRERH